jgi:hypothetical protein
LFFFRVIRVFRGLFFEMNVGSTMSDHNWVLENLESYSAGGLDAGEREHLEDNLPE